MKIAWMLFGSIMILLLAYALWHKESIRHEQLTSTQPQTYTDSSRNGGVAIKKQEDFFEKVFKNKKQPTTIKLSRLLLADSIVNYGLSLMGTPYLPAGITCEGFDCSGFVYHIYQKYGIDLPHSSAMLLNEGTEVPLAEARKGDLIIFTGTNASDPTPGHVGVVITAPGQPVAFVHASSATRKGGVKISKIDNSGYKKRFLQVRRVL